MASPTVPPVPWGYRPAPWMPSRAAMPSRVHVLARLAFWTILLLSLTNAIGVFVGAIKRSQDALYELSIYPIVFGVCMVIVLAFSKGRTRSTLLIVCWTFWLLFFLCGFLGVNQITATDVRSTLRLTIKPWMSIIGLPWLALRATSEDKVPRLIHVTVIVACLGAVVGFLQIGLPGFMETMIAAAGRAEGLWTNPTMSGMICTMALFLTLVSPFKSRVLNVVSRLVLLAGVATTLSRGAILALLVGWVVYAVSARRFGALLKSAVGLVLFVMVTVAVIGATEALSGGHASRLASVRSLLAGEWGAGTFTDRTDIWMPAVNTILSERGVLFGLGHGAMSTVVDSAYGGLAPHNYYIYVLGTSGILALFGLLAFHFALFQQASGYPDRQGRAALLAIATVWAVAHVVDDSMIGHPTMGAIFACVVVTVAYARPQDSIRRRGKSPIYNGSLRPQAR